MNFVKIAFALLFAFFSCQRNDADFSVTLPDIKGDALVESEVVLVPVPVKNDSIHDGTDSQVVQEMKIDSIPAGITEKITGERQKKVLKQAGAVHDKKEAKTSSEKGCSGLAGNPLTTDDAAGCSMHHWEIALALAEKKHTDSAYIHCKRALTLYENGSLFYLKAVLLNMKGNPAAALQAAEISLGRSDHWKVADKDYSIIERCEALTALYDKYPSSGLEDKVKNCFWKY